MKKKESKKPNESDRPKNQTTISTPWMFAHGARYVALLEAKNDKT